MVRAFPNDRIYVLPTTNGTGKFINSTISLLTGNPDVSAKYIIAAVQITHTFV